MARILIVDDEPMVIRIYRLALEAEGYQVATAPNGALGLESIRQQAPDALVTDIEMPRMSGEELCLALAKEMPDRKFPIVVQTSLTADQHRSWSAGIDNLLFLEKPISMRRLIDSLDQLLGSEQSAAGAHA